MPPTSKPNASNCRPWKPSQPMRSDIIQTSSVREGSMVDLDVALKMDVRVIPQKLKMEIQNIIAIEE